MDEVARTGKPIAELRPQTGKRLRLLFGLHKGLVEIRGIIVSSIDAEREAFK